MRRDEKVELVSFCHHLAQEFDLGNIRSTEQLIRASVSFLGELLGLDDDVLLDRLEADPWGTLAQLEGMVQAIRKPRKPRTTNTRNPDRRGDTRYPEKDARITARIKEGWTNEEIYREVGGNRNRVLERIRDLRREYEYRHVSGANGPHGALMA